MVEGERQEGTPVPEINTRILEETTLAGLGVETPNDNLNLASDRLTLAVGRGGRPSTTVNLVFDHHPFSGEHFARLLGSIAPFGSGGREGILADLQMPVIAKQELEEGVENSYNAYLHRRHLKDPEIGPPYERFVEQNLDSWRTALDNNASSDVFRDLQRVTFIKSLSDFTPQAFQQWKKMPSEHACWLTATAFSYYQKGGRFVSFLKDKINLEMGENEQSAYFRLSLAQKERFIYDFLEQLTGEEKEEFTLADIVDRKKQILVDLDRKQVEMYRDLNSSTEVKFVDEKCVQIKDYSGNVVKVVPNKDIGSGCFDWVVKDYEFSSSYLSTAIYPVIAWGKEENGKRRFLSQNEARPYLIQLSIEEAEKGDVKMGEIMAVYFSPGVTDKWEKEMPLKPLEEDKRDDYKQPMMGAQVPVWVSLQDHSAQLFSEKNGLFDRLEQGMVSLGKI